MISIVPETSLVHENISIIVTDLRPHRIYKLELRLLHKVGTYRSFGVFKSSVAGRISLSHDAPLRGTYSGVNQRGLFETVEPTESVRFGAYCNCTPPVAFQYHLILGDEHGRKVGEKCFNRMLMHPLVERKEVEENTSIGRAKITGTMFKPPGDGPFPTIIDISGSGGGINEQKAAAFASRGFAAFSLSFFQFKSLPENLHAVDIQYFEDAISYVCSLPYTSKRIGFQGVSFGGTLTMILATRFPAIKAACSINGSWAFDEATHITVHENQPPIAKFIDIEENTHFLNGMLVYAELCKRMVLEDGEEGIPFEESKPDTAFRFVSAMDDLSTPTLFSTNRLSQKLRELGRTVEVHLLPGGHLLDPPCFPHHPLCFSKIAGTFQTYGGETSLHGRSQFEAWEGTVKFFAKHLGTPTPLPHPSKHSPKL